MNKQGYQEQMVSAAFSAQSPEFDAITTNNPMEVLYRNLAREQVMKFALPGQSLLELNCGTGLDAVFFAEKGLKVLATDNSDGMLAQLDLKIKDKQLGAKIRSLKCSFNQLDELGRETKFDQVFSNFGGLNCASNLQAVALQLDQHLNKGARVHLVLIAPLCLWELAAVFKGRFSYAFRRLKASGTRSHLEGHYFTTYYYSVGAAKKAFGSQYKVLALQSLGCFLPPTFKDQFPGKWPFLFGFLKKIEAVTRHTWPFNRIGDLYVLSLEKK